MNLPVDTEGRGVEFHPLANVFPLLVGDEFEALAADIKEHGLREAIWLYEGMILDGRNRYRACQIKDVDAAFRTYHGDDPLAFVVSLNLKRRHLNESQRAMAAAKVATLGDGQTKAGAPIGAASQDDAAEMLNVGRRSVQRAQQVQDHGTPELVDAVERGEVSVSAAADVATLPEEEQGEIVARGEKEILERAKEIRAKKAETRRTERIEKLAEISKGNTELGTEQKYPIIYADPPWRYENPPMGASNRSIENHYPTMTLEEICAVPVANISTDDALLYLWATAPKLAECIQVITAWGFEYRTSFVWIKDKIGMGYHARNQHELLLVAKRGAIPPPAVENRVSSVIEAVRGKHSEKPDEFYALIETMYPELPKIELFRRDEPGVVPREGWAAWGNQASAA